MNGIEKITGRIASDARAQADHILSDAKAQAEAIASDAQAQARQERESILAQGEKAAEERAGRIAAMAQLEGRKRLLAARQESIGKAFDRALEKLTALPTAEYTEILAKMAAKVTATGKESLILSAKDRKKIGRQVVSRANEILAEKLDPEASEKLRGSREAAEKFRGSRFERLEKKIAADSARLASAGMITLSRETRDIPGGFILADEGVELNCAFDTLVRLSRPELERQVAQILFGEGA